MRKNYTYLLLLLFLNTALFAQTVTLIPTVVNGANVSSGPINLGAVPYSTISLTVKVEIPANIVVNNQGTIKVYFSKGTGLGTNVAIGGDGSALYFGGEKIAYRNFTINLKWTDFSTSGGYIYAEYKNNTSHKSSNVTVTKNTTVNSGTILNPPNDAPNPNSIVNTLCCNQTIRLGDKPAPITGSQFLNPYEPLPYGINSLWNINKGGIIELDNINKTLLLDYTTELGDIIVNRKLGYNHNNQFPNKSNDVIIKVVPSPILRNEISVNETPNSEGYIELSSLKKTTITGFNSIVNLKVLQDPYYTIQARDPGAEVESYKWEYHDDSLFKNPWITIPDESEASIEFSNPSQFNSDDTHYSIRRIAIYKDISRVSNVIKFIVRGLRYNNTICCDQNLKILSPSEIESPSSIIGSTPTLENSNIDGTNLQYYVSYQWQSKKLNEPNNWLNITNAISKDYHPPLLKITSENPRRPYISTVSNYSYRRISTLNYQTLINNQWKSGTKLSYSNEVNLIGTKAETPLLTIYPNPTSSILNIESIQDIFTNTVEISITNSAGTVVINNNFSVINEKLATINVSSLILGTYFINIKTERRSYQLIFIKD